MEKSKVIILMIIILCFLLNSTTVLSSQPHEPDSMSIKKVLKNKDAEIEEKFQEVKKWFEERKPSFNQFLSNGWSQLKGTFREVYNDIMTRINGLSERHYTKL